jgi:FixJ family two-component response regulator
MPTTETARKAAFVGDDEGPIYLIDDNDAFRKSTQWLLEGHGFAVTSFSSARSFLDQLEAGVVDVDFGCLLLDLRMPQMSGTELQEVLRQKGCRLPIVFISGHGDVALAVEAMRKGAAHFIEKPFADGALVEALHDVRRSARMRSASGGAVDEIARARLATLTARERQVLDLVVQGKMNKVIADLLGVSIKTVELHRSRVMTKMQASSFAELVQLEMRAH